MGCSKSIDISNDKDVMAEIQGEWITYENIGNFYRHIKVGITKNSFEAWVQTSDNQNEPKWADQPDEKGIISLNSVQPDAEKNSKFRKFAFVCSGRCCGDKSSSVKLISDLISYEENAGLTLSRKIKMNKR